MPYSPMHLTNNVLRRAFDDDVALTPMKLQRLLYFTAQEYTKLTDGVSLAHEAFRSWAAGPVLLSVHEKFRSVGSGPITGYSKDAAGNAHRIDERSDANLALALDRVWVQGRRFTVLELCTLSTKRGSAWAKTENPGLGSFIRVADFIDDDSYLERFGLSQLTITGTS